MANNSAREGEDITPLSGRAKLGLIAFWSVLWYLLRLSFFTG